MTKNVSDLILHILAIHRRTKQTPTMTTYELRKQMGISWSTTKIHCYELLEQKKIHHKIERAEVGEGKKEYWWVDLKHTDEELKEKWKQN